MDYQAHQPVLDLINILAQKNIHTAVLCPGSRCAPLALALVRHPQFVCHTLTDERVAAYAALGMAQQHGAPVVLVCTSGTAALNFAPAIAEAYHQNIPLIVLTADRPTEWIHQEDGQAIYQTELYKNFVAQSYTLPAHTTPATRWHAQRIANQAANVCVAQQQPVHINIPLHEPLYNIPKNVQVADLKLIHELIDINHIGAGFFDDFDTNTLIVVGQQPPNQNFVAVMYEVMQKNPQFTIFAEPTSNCALPQVCFDAQTIISRTYHTVVCVGSSLVNKQVKQHLRSNPPQKLYNIGKKNAHADAFMALTHIIHGTLHSDNTHILPKNIPTISMPPLPIAHAHYLLWVIFNHLPHNINLHLANSMSVRWAGMFAACLVGKNINVYANRGTSGIDGCTSTALGAAIASPHRQNVLITGDLAFVYDSNALWNKYNPDNLKIIVLNNGGGGIFSKLDAAHQPEFNDYFFTPNTAHIDSLCAGFGAHHTKFDGDNTGFQSVLEDFLQPKKNSTATSVLEIAVGNA